jgi:LysR family transcriptional regulator, hypochlorite-specific transcription factor HypT
MHFARLIVISETRSFRKAAELRNVTQSGFSRRIQALEHWAGARLIDRRKSPLKLTAAGQTILDVAQEIMGKLNGARREVRDKHSSKMRSIAFAAPHILSVTFFPRWLPTVQAMLGAIQFSVTSANLPDCVTALEDGDVDFLVCLIDEDQGLLQFSEQSISFGDRPSIVIGREQFVALSAPQPDGQPTHRIGGDSKSETSYLAYSNGCSLAWAVERKLASSPALSKLTRLYENSLADGLRTMALAGLGAAWLPLAATHQDILRGRLVRAAPEDLDIPLEIRMYRPSQNLTRKAEQLWKQLQATPADISVNTTAPESQPQQVPLRRQRGSIE